MKKWVFQWYNISVYLAVLFALILGFGKWDIRQQTILMATVCLYLHFFEEFGFPGGFPWIGVHVEFGTNDTDSEKWELNHLNAMVGNWWFSMFVFMLAFLLPKVKFMTLAVVLFAFVEVFAHLLLFNISLKRLYNPGLVSAVFGLAPVSIRYFVQIHGQGIYSIWDYVMAFAWIVINYWFVFRSPFYKWMGKKSDQYAIPKEEVMKAAKYMK